MNFGPSARERLELAVEQVSPTATPIKTRLLSAAISLGPLRTEDLPEGEQRAALDRIKAALVGSAPEGSSDPLSASLGSMTDDAAEAIAQQIRDLYGAHTAGPA